VRTLQTTTVTSLGRIYLGKEVMKLLHVEIGDHIQIYDNGGRLYIAKVVPPSEV